MRELLKGMMRLPLKKLDDGFCRAYLRTMDPERAADDAQCPGEGFSRLAQKSVRAKLDRMRGDSAGQIRREDAVRRLAQLAFGRANDAVALALNPHNLDPEALDLSAVAEFRVTDKGGVEVKLVDRVRALETLCDLLESGAGLEAQQLCQALENAAGQLDWED